MDLTDVVELDTPKGRSNEILTDHIDLGALCETTFSVLRVITEILSDLGVRLPFQSLDSFVEIKAACESLDTHINYLLSILRGYARHWRPGGRNTQLPIDPGLSGWLSRLKLQLVGTQEMIKGLGTRSLSSMDMTMARSYCEDLKGFSSEMDGLMTIIQRLVTPVSLSLRLT
jgi:hypothetical protein